MKTKAQTVTAVIFGWLSALLIFIIAGATSANAADLTDFVTPEELAYENNFQPLDMRSMFFKASATDPRLKIVVNMAEKGTANDAQTLEAFVDGELLYRAVVSTGKQTYVTTPNGTRYFAGTPRGQFKITRRSRNHVSSKWPGASMPFAQFFVGGIAIHATTPDHFSMLGRRDSGGCVRLHPRDAELIWNLVSRVTTQETEIYVYDGSKTAHPLGRSGETPKYKARELNVNEVQPTIVLPTIA